MTDTGVDPLDEILADDPPPAEQGATEQTTTPEPEGQPRGPDGKSAPKADEPQSQEQHPQPTQQPTGQQQGTVPLPALHAEREARKAAEARAEAIERQLAEMRGQVQLLAQQRQHPTDPKPQAKAPDFWENPDAFVKSALSPVEQQMQEQRESFSRMMAVQSHGRETVQAAYQAPGTALQTDPMARFEYQRIMASDHPYDEMVAWHKKTATLQKIGGRPDAYVNAELERRLSDPAEQAKILERIRAAAQTTQSRSGTAPTALPPSLNRLPGSGNAPAEAMSGEELFNHIAGDR